MRVAVVWGIQSGETQPEQLKQHPCTQMAQRNPGPRVRVLGQISAMFSDTMEFKRQNYILVFSGIGRVSVGLS